MIKVKVGTICAEVARVISGHIDTNCYHLLLFQNHSELKSKHILFISGAVTNAAMICIVPNIGPIGPRQTRTLVDETRAQIKPRLCFSEALKLTLKYLIISNMIHCKL